MGMTRGELAKSCDIHPETVRYYEQHGLIAAAARTGSGYRMFSDEAARRIRFIKRAQAAGFSLDEIKALLNIQHDPDGTSGEVRDLVDTKIADIDTRIAALQTMRSILMKLVDACPGGSAPVSECPILEYFDTADAV